MTAHELQGMVHEAMKTVREMDARTRKLALNSGVLDRMFEQQGATQLGTANPTDREAHHGEKVTI